MAKKANQDWKLYEETILEHFRDVYPDFEIKGDQKIIGIKTKEERQIDILISGEVAGFPIKIVVDCKHFSRRVGVKTVEMFLGMLEDLKVSKGAIITNVGFTKDAIKRAKFDSRDIQLDTIDFEDLPQFSGVGDAFPSKWNDKEKMAVVFSCPFGWQIHPTPTEGIPAGLTRAGVSWKDAWNSKECIYMGFVSKSEFPRLEDIFAFHETASLENYPGVEFDYIENLDERFENSFCERMVLRIGYYRQYPETEATLFLDFGTFITFFALTTPKKNRDVNLKKLAFIGRSTIPYDLPSKTDVLPFEYLKFHFVPNLFIDRNKSSEQSNQDLQ